MPLPDVVALLADSTGKFEISLYQGQHNYELHVVAGNITRVLFNDNELTDARQSESFVKELVRADEGSFEFIRCIIYPGPHEMPLRELMDLGLAEADEINLLSEHFPDADTIFVPTRKVHVALDGELQSFWQAARPVLESGASAHDLFNQLGLFLDQVLLRLYKLRASGLIETFRADLPAPGYPLHYEDDRLAHASNGPHRNVFISSADYGITLNNDGPNPHPSTYDFKLSPVEIDEADDDTLNELMQSVEEAIQSQR